MLVPSQVQDIYPKAEKYLSKLMIDKIKDWFVKENEILLTCSETIGNVTLVTETLINVFLKILLESYAVMNFMAMFMHS